MSDMEEYRRTALSAGLAIHHILKHDSDVMSKAGDVFPIVVDEAKLPYVVFRREGIDVNTMKDGGHGADTAMIEVSCCAASYSGSVELAEAVRRALDHCKWDVEGVRMRSCSFVGGSEDYRDDAFVQDLTFKVNI